MKNILVILLLLSMGVNAQKKWYLPTKKESLSYVFFGLSGISKGYHEAIEHHRYGEGSDFWSAKTGWKRKYKDFDNGDMSARFPGSKTWLVTFTDGQHLTQTGNTLFLVTGVVLNTWDMKHELREYDKKDRWKVVAFKKILLPMLIRTMTFEFTFKQL